MTRLQAAASKSPLLRRLVAAFMHDEGMPLLGFKRLVNGIFSDSIASMPDPDIKRLLYAILLQCYDVSAEDRREALRLLQLADTALTGAQLAAMKHSLSE